MPVLGDTLNPMQWMGAAMIIGSVVVLAWMGDEHKERTAPKSPFQVDSPPSALRIRDGVPL
jgi:hypothetical protein